MTTKTKTSLIELKNYEGKYNVLFPQATMQQISPFHRVRVETVKIDPNPEAGDVFKVGSKQVNNRWQNVLSLSKTGVLKLATAAGIVWNWQDTRVLSSSKDYVLFQAVGAMRKPSGEWIPLKATKELDMDVIEAETYEFNLKKAEGLSKEQRKGMTPEQHTERQTKTNMIQWKKNKLMRAETGAMLRVVRALLSIKHQYSPKELEQPFAVPTVDFSPDYSDPEVRKMIAQEGIRATADLFGQGSSAGQLAFNQHQLPPAVDVNTLPKKTTPPVFNDTSGDGDKLPWSGAGEVEHEEEQGEQQEKDPFSGAAPACSDCGQVIQDAGRFSASSIIDLSLEKFKRVLCYDCSKKAAAKGGAKK